LTTGSDAAAASSPGPADADDAVDSAALGETVLVATFAPDEAPGGEAGRSHPPPPSRARNTNRIDDGFILLFSFDRGQTR
jgi:hypothetical protein